MILEKFDVDILKTKRRISVETDMAVLTDIYTNLIALKCIFHGVSSL